MADYLSLYLNEFLMLYSANLINLTSPGAGFTVTAHNSLSHSRKAGILTGLGIVTSSLIHKTYTFIGFGYFVAKTPWLFTTIKILGGTFLIYLGTKAFLSLRNLATKNPRNTFTQSEAQKSLSPFAAYRIGFLTDFLNPQASICFIGIVTATVSPSTPMNVQWLYCSTLLLTSLVWYTVVALFFSNKFLQQRLNNFKIFIESLAGVVLIALGAKLLILTPSLS